MHTRAARDWFNSHRHARPLKLGWAPAKEDRRMKSRLFACAAVAILMTAAPLDRAAFAATAPQAATSGLPYDARRGAYTIARNP